MNENFDYSKEMFEIINKSFGIACNANDFFQAATGDTLIIDPLDLKWVLPIYRKYGLNGLHACMSHIRKIITERELK